MSRFKVRSTWAEGVLENATAEGAARAFASLQRGYFFFDSVAEVTSSPTESNETLFEFRSSNATVLHQVWVRAARPDDPPPRKFLLL